MTIAAERIPELEFNSVVSAEIFRGHADAAFWIGKVALDEPEYYDALARFRANVYVGQMGFLGPEQIDSQGRELDHDDERSLHFGAIERLKNEGLDSARIVASGRLIVKDCTEEPLPIEAAFPEIFADKPVAVGAVEVSRFISRHDDDFVQHKLALGIIRAMTYYSVNNDIRANYFIIEKPLLKLLTYIGLPLETLGQPKEIVEPGGVSTLYPICIDSRLILDSLKKDVHNRITLRQFFKNEEHNNGEGFYPASLVGGTNG